MEHSRFFSFLIYIQSVGLLGRGISPSQGRYLHTGQHKHRINTLTYIPRVGFEPTIPVFEREKTVHTSDHAATMIDVCINLLHEKFDLFASRTVFLEH
jgi:hypothetical protein